MEQKTIALQLGLPETATEAEITAKINELNAAKTENDTLKKDKETLTLANITSAVETAISEKRIAAEKKEQFIELGKKVGIDELQNIFAAMSPQVKLSQTLGHQGGAPTGAPATYQKFCDVPSDKLLELREKNPDKYKRLYKAEYGIECEI